jgi:hypothetical protein
MSESTADVTSFEDERAAILELVNESNCTDPTEDAALANHFLEQARLRYEDVFNRAENVERRAATLQASVVFAITLTLTGGALLLDSGKVPDEAWRERLAVAAGVAVLFFVVSGSLASWVAVRVKGWKVVGPASLQSKTFDSLATARRTRAAAYLACNRRNKDKNDRKGTTLQWAFSFFLLGLVALLVLAGLLVGYAIEEPPVAPMRP